MILYRDKGRTSELEKQVAALQRRVKQLECDCSQRRWEVKATPHFGTYICCVNCGKEQPSTSPKTTREKMVIAHNAKLAGVTCKDLKDA